MPDASSTSITVRRCGNEHAFTQGRDLWYHELVADQPAECEPEPMDAEDLLYLLYTSGTTGKPKGIVHTTGGYLTQVRGDAPADLRHPRRRRVSGARPTCGWVTGHSYIVYGPLANHTTGVMYEGAPDWPDKDRWWSIVERYRVTILYTAPTAIRAFMRWGTEFPEKHDLSSLRLLGSVGEPINPEAWVWYWKVIGGERCPVVDTWWQTETGAILITPLPGHHVAEAGLGDAPVPRDRGRRLDERGGSVPLGGGGLPRAEAPMAVDRAHDLGRPGPVRADVLQRVRPGDVRRRRRRAARRGGLLLAARADRRRDERGGPPALDVRDRDRRSSTTTRSPRRPSCRKPHEIKGEGIVAFVTLKARLRGRRRRCSRSCASTWPR